MSDALPTGIRRSLDRLRTSNVPVPVSEVAQRLLALDRPVAAPLARRIVGAALGHPPDALPELIGYQQEVEDFKDKLFHIDAGITSTVGAIAETGAIILWPTENEPRLMSLVPPIHIAVLKADKIFNTFCEVIQAENWPQKMPTNVVLISGPSKTADIELVLAFGVHGPKELIVLIVED